MKNELNDKFSLISENNCIKVSNKDIFFIEDSEKTKKSYIFYDENKANSQFFSVTNPKFKEINLLQIDHCLFFDNNKEKCDFALFDDKDFIFVELKEKRANQRSRGMKKAINQLKSTISIFKDNIDFDKHNLEAYICVGKQGKPGISAKKQDLQLEFEDEYSARLFFGCGKRFL